MYEIIYMKLFLIISLQLFFWKNAITIISQTTHFHNSVFR